MCRFRIWALLLIVAGTSRAVARETQGEAPPPPPPRYAPPDTYPPPVYLVPPLAREEIDALERRGRHKVIGGDVLLATGGALALTGTALGLASLFVDEESCASHPHDGNWHYCGNPALAYAGGATVGLGMATLIPGAFLWASGGRDLATAHMLRRNGCCTWSVQPRVSARAATAELGVGF